MPLMRVTGSAVRQTPPGLPHPDLIDLRDAVGIQGEVTGAAGNQLGIAGVRQRHPGGLVDSEVIGLGPDVVRGRRVGELERLGLPETCNGTSHSGCSRLAATVTVGTGPFGVAVNDRTHTVYVVNNAFGDAPGTVSVINGATCNGTVTAGCGRHFPTMATGVAPQLAAVDAATGIIYVTDFGSAGGDHPGRITLQRLGDQRMRRAPSRASGRVRAGRPGRQPADQHRLRGRHVPGRIPVSPRHRPQAPRQVKPILCIARPFLSCGVLPHPRPGNGRADGPGHAQQAAKQDQRRALEPRQRYQRRDRRHGGDDGEDPDRLAESGDPGGEEDEDAQRDDVGGPAGDEARRA
jgi:hypothetical protein